MIGQTIHSALLPQYNNNLIRALVGMRVERKKIPGLKPGEVLVEMAFAPCNPSDIAFLRGVYNIVKSLPAVPGFEASGTIVDTAGDEKHMLGKRVSCFVQGDADGTWASHFVARASDCNPLKEGLDMKQAACLGINPLTGLGMYEAVTQKKCKAFILNAAGGQVARFMSALARRDAIPVIHIVRKKDEAERMKKAGLAYVLNSSADDFDEALNDLCADLKPGLAFDAVAGELSGKMLKAMPPQASLVVYGALAATQLEGIRAMDVIFQGKSIQGFNLNTWIRSMDRITFVSKTDEIQDMILQGKWQSEIQALVPLHDVVKGIRTYIQSMSGGKVLFYP